MAENQGGFFAGLRGPREIIFGSGQRRSLPKILRRFGKRAFLCIDPHLVEHPAVIKLIQSIREQGTNLEVFSEIAPELPLKNLANAVVKAHRHAAEVILAVGGGSSIDMAKMVACEMAHEKPVQDFYGEFNVPGPVLPLIAVPTTAGTGSEVTPVAVLTDTERGLKVGVSSPYLIPTIALCDPELTVTCPADVTAASGTDALSHCIESYTAVRRLPEPGVMDRRVFIGASNLTSSLALEGIRHITSSLLTAYKEPENITARESVMYGSLLGGLAFGTAGNAAAHALQYPIGAETKTPHGVGIGLLLPYVMQYNLAARTREYAEIATVFGTDEVGTQEQAAQAPELVQSYLHQMDIPTRLNEIAFPKERLSWAAEQGIGAVRLADNNPRVLDLKGAQTILNAAAEGRLSAV